MSRVLLALRRRIVSARRFGADVIRMRVHRYACAGVAVMPGFETRVRLEQSVGTSEHGRAKRHNIARAAETINTVVIHPGELFSFWRIVGRPSEARGFLPGRSLIGGHLVLDYGGGLCQLAGMIYHAALHAGLQVVERHPHSRDIYTEEERYTPLGADAAVAYGLKDLRLANIYPFPVGFRIDVAEATAAVALCAPGPVVEHHVQFVRLEAPQGERHVETWCTEGVRRTRVAVSRYIVAEASLSSTR